MGKQSDLKEREDASADDASSDIKQQEELHLWQLGPCRVRPAMKGDQLALNFLEAPLNPRLIDSTSMIEIVGTPEADKKRNAEEALREEREAFLRYHPAYTMKDFEKGGRFEAVVYEDLRAFDDIHAAVYRGLSLASIAWVTGHRFRVTFQLERWNEPGLSLSVHFNARTGKYEVDELSAPLFHYGAGELTFPGYGDEVSLETILFGSGDLAFRKSRHQWFWIIRHRIEKWLEYLWVHGIFKKHVEPCDDASGNTMVVTLQLFNLQFLNQREARAFFNIQSSKGARDIWSATFDFVLHSMAPEGRYKSLYPYWWRLVEGYSVRGKMNGAQIAACNLIDRFAVAALSKASLDPFGREIFLRPKRFPPLKKRRGGRVRELVGRLRLSKGDVEV